MTAFIRSDVDTLAAYIKDNITTSATEADLSLVLKTFVETNPTTTPLPAVKFDYESNKALLMSLLAKKPAWQDAIISATGQMFLEFFATAMTYSQFSIQQAARETALTAQGANSIYEITRMLGVKIKRPSPANCPVTLTRTGSLDNSLTIPAFTKFSVGGQEHFSREPITFNANVSQIDTIVYEGSLKVEQFISTGQKFQTYLIGSPEYNISDEDVYSMVGINPIVNYVKTNAKENYTTGLWEYGPTDTVFVEQTTADGSVEVIFGNGGNGQIPPTGQPIYIVYAITNGADGNLNLSNLEVTLDNISTVTGICSGTSYGGANGKSAREYKILGPGTFAAKERPTTITDYENHARNYPGVIDAKFKGQQDINPYDKNYMMVIEATLVTNTEWSLDPLLPQPEWDAFEAWLQAKGIANIQLIRRNAVKRSFQIKSKVFCRPDVGDLDAFKQRIKARIVNFFAARAGCLGTSYFISDIMNSIEKTDQTNVEFVQLESPTTEMLVSDSEWASVALEDIDLDMKYTKRVTDNA